MWSLLLVLLMVTTVQCEETNDHDIRLNEVQATVSPEVLEKFKKFHDQVKKTHKDCRLSNWACDPHCSLDRTEEFKRQKASNKTDRLQCFKHTEPSDVTCFGMPFSYNYSDDAPINATFPDELEVLRKFPQCWKNLAPLICYYHFRPCSMRAAFRPKEEPQFVFVNQKLRRSVCDAARKACGFVIDKKYWPKYIDCDDKTFFSDEQECKRDTLVLMPEEQEQCIFPLVTTRFASDNSKSVRSAVIVDKCALPCRNLFVLPESRNNFLRTVGVFAAVCCVACTLAFLWLMLSEAYRTCMMAFSLSNAVGCFGVIWLIWWVSTTDTYYDSAICLPDGSKRLGGPTLVVEWCTVQFASMYMAIMCSATWLNVFFVLRFSQIEISCFDGRLFRNRLSLIFAVSVLPFIGICVAWTTNEIDTDGISGICFVGAYNFRSAVMFIYSPIALLFIVSTCVIMFFHWQHQTNRRSKVRSLSRNLTGDDLESENSDNEGKKMSNSAVVAVEENDDKQTPPVSIRLSVILVMCYVLGAIVSVMLHSAVVRSADHEFRAVHQYIDCNLNRTILKADLDWLHQGKLRNPQCELPAALDTTSLLQTLVLGMPIALCSMLLLCIFFGVPNVLRIRRFKLPSWRDVKQPFFAQNRETDRIGGGSSVSESEHGDNGTDSIVVLPRRTLSAGDMLPITVPSLIGDQALSDTGGSKARQLAQFKEGMLQRSAQHKQQLQRRLLATATSSDDCASVVSVNAPLRLAGHRVKFCQERDDDYATAFTTSNHTALDAMLSNQVVLPANAHSRPPTQLTNGDTTLPDNLGSEWSMNGSFPDHSRYPVLPQSFVDGYNKCLADMETTMLKKTIIHQDSTIAMLQNTLQAVIGGRMGTPGGMQQQQIAFGAAMGPMSPQLTAQFQQQQQQSNVFAHGHLVNNTAPSLLPYFVTSPSSPHEDGGGVSRTQSMSDDHIYGSAVTAPITRQQNRRFGPSGKPSVVETAADNISVYSSTPTEDSLDSDELDPDEERFVEEQNALRKRLRPDGEERIEQQTTKGHHRDYTPGKEPL